MKRIPWLRMRKKTDPELPYEPPIWFGNMSNGEYFRPATKKDRLMRKLILETASDNARKVGMDRREFLASAMGMATSLWCLNYVSACSSSPSAGKTTGGTKIKDGGLSDKDASFCVSKEAMFDPHVACDAVTGHEFIFDVQTHWFNKADLAHFPLYLQLFGSLFDVATEDAYIKDMFCNSDTTIACLTAWPGVACTNGRVDNCGLPLSNESNAASRDKINFQLAQGTQRVLNHFQVMVQDQNGVEPQLALMEAAACNGFGLHAWKMYPGFQPIFTLDDDKGRAVIDKGLSLGVPLFCVHKGLPIGTFFSVEGNHPRDVGVVAKDYKDTPAKFIVYHSAIDAGVPGPGDGGTAGTTKGPPEGPYDATEAKPTGVNALVRALQDNGIPPNANVFGEIGSAINQVMKDPVATAHFFGKLLKYIGTENVVWGTDCVIYGSPQPFIQWFRTATIPQSMQDQYGYPALDTAQKAKIFGLNAARIYGVNVDETICKVSTCPTALLKERLDQEVGPNRWMFEEPGGPKNWDEFVQHSQDCVRLGRPG